VERVVELVLRRALVLDIEKIGMILGRMMRSDEPLFRPLLASV